MNELMTEQKLREHERLDKVPATCFLESHSGVWHPGVRREFRYHETKLIQSVYYVCACNGRSLYRPYSRATKAFELPEGVAKCSPML